MALLTDLTRVHVLSAIEALNHGFEHRFGEPTKFVLWWKGRKYAPKAVVGVAIEIATGKHVGPHDFSSGIEKSQAVGKLRSLGFDVRAINEAVQTDTYLLTWNPTNPDAFRDYERYVRLTGNEKRPKNKWLASRASIKAGDRLFLLRQIDERGIVASGYALGEPEPGEHWSGEEGIRLAKYVPLRFDVVLPIENRLRLETVANVEGVAWSSIYESGRLVPGDSALILERLWQEHLRALGRRIEPLPDELAVPEQFPEGAKRKITVNAYERNPAARRNCVKHYGTDCAVCGFDFGEFYGELGAGYIHVHHLKDLATVGEHYNVDPIEDLRPVCPNCHAMLHQESPAMCIERLRAVINEQRQLSQ